MFLGHIGEHAIESVYEVRAGDNFGWSERGGPLRLRQDRPVQPLPAMLLLLRSVRPFLHASTSGDLDGLTRLLARDVRVITDGGGKVAAALNVINGAEPAARFIVGATRKGLTGHETVRPAAVNGLPGLIIEEAGRLIQTVAFEIEGGVIRAIYVVRNPDKLRHLSAAG